MKWADINPLMEETGFSEVIGQGDFDPAEIGRLKTGLLAISAVKEMQRNGGLSTNAKASVSAKKSPVAATPVKATQVSLPNAWSIQVGAFSSRVSAEKVIEKARRKLPGEFAMGQPYIAPMKTGKGWIFRGRLNGYTREQAHRACAYVDDCLPVAPAL
jgi:hypothetical protein